MNNSTSQKALIPGGTPGIGLAPAQHIVSQVLARTDPGCIKIVVSGSARRRKSQSRCPKPNTEEAEKHKAMSRDY